MSEHVSNPNIIPQYMQDAVEQGRHEAAAARREQLARLATALQELALEKSADETNPDNPRPLSHEKESNNE